MRFLIALVAVGLCSAPTFCQSPPTAPALVPARTVEAPPAPSSAADGSVPEGVAASDWARIRAAYEAGRHQVFAVEGGYQARNPGQQLTTRFDGRGFCTTLDAGTFSFGLDLVSYGWSGDGHAIEHAVETPRSVTAEGGRVAYVWDEWLTEWYVNDVRGLEHGYTVHARPADADGSLTLALAIRGGLAAQVSRNGRDVRLTDATGAVVLNYAGLAVFDADGRAVGGSFAVGADGLRLSVDDRGARYPLTIDPVVQQAYLKASNTDAGDRFGRAVAISGDTIVVGSPDEDSNATGVDGDESNDSAAGAGAAYVFVRSGTNWSQQAYLKASNTEHGDAFGGSVAIDGDTIVVGASLEDSGATDVDGDESDNGALDAGAAFVFVRNGAVWSQEAYLKASNSGTGDRFGHDVAVSGDAIVVGANREGSTSTGINGDGSDNSVWYAGAAYVFARSGTTWIEEAYVNASNTGVFDLFGTSVAIADDTLVIGASGESSDATGIDGDQKNNRAAGAGAAFVFVRSSTTWTQQSYVKASNTDAYDYFGVEVAGAADSIVVGAYGEDSNANGVNGNEADDSASSAGAAYVFVRSGTTWSQQSYLKASNTNADDEFGWSIALYDDAVVVGAPREDSDATGIDGPQSNNLASNSGAAYLFERSGASWSQQSYLKASNTDANDEFGGSVALSGDAAIIGAHGESSSAMGVDGSQGDDSAMNAGAAYVFDLDQASGSFATYGAGTAGLGGFVPSAALSGSPVIDEDVTLSIRDGLGGAPALLITGFARASIPFAGGSLLVATPWIMVNVTLVGTLGVAGAGALDVSDTLPDDPAIVGFVVDFQVLVADPAAAKKLALSNGAELVIGG